MYIFQYKNIKLTIFINIDIDIDLDIAYEI